MTNIEKKHSVITPEEMAMLNETGKKQRPTGVDRGFRYRHIALVLISFIVVSRLLFFS